MAQFEPYLCFDGTCAEAMRFYEKTLGGRIEMMMTFGEAPPDSGMPPMDGAKDLILHASMTLDGHRLMASDSPPGMPFQKMQGIAVSLGYPTAEQGRRVFDALAEGGQVTMPYGKTFWADGFGMVVDRFGTPWMVNAGPAGP
jgi:PhnB protein